MAYGDVATVGNAVLMTVKNELGYHPEFGAKVVLEWRVGAIENTTYGNFPRFYPVAVAETKEDYGYPVRDTYQRGADTFCIVYDGEVTVVFSDGAKVLARHHKTQDTDKLIDDLNEKLY